MAQDQSALHDLLEVLRTAEGGQFVNRLLAGALQALIELEATAAIGAAPHERTPTRTTRRNGSRPKTITTAAGDVTVAIPKTRTGSFFPSLLEPRRRIDRALHAVICEAYVHGVSTRKVDDVVAAMGGLAGVSKSEVSRICAALDAEVAAFAQRPLEGAVPYLFADAYCKVRVNGRVVSQAVVVATGVSADGRREVLGHAVGDSETEQFWTEFFRSLRERGLTGVQLVISDAHRGLTAAVAAVLQGASWQRCRVHFLRNALAKVRKGDAEMVAAAIRTIFAQPTAAGARPGGHRRGPAREQVPGRRGHAARRQGGPDRVRRFPRGALEKDLEHQSVGTPPQRDQAPDRRRRDLPEPRRAVPPHRRRARRSPRRVAGGRPPLPVRNQHGRAVRHPDGAADTLRGGAPTRTRQRIISPKRSPRGRLLPPLHGTRSAGRPAVTPPGRGLTKGGHAGGLCRIRCARSISHMK